MIHVIHLLMTINFLKTGFVLSKVYITWNFAEKKAADIVKTCRTIKSS
uniref:Uncharacterized protein n=1 Tax=Faecalibaculum rodentium TaxID=1702221 RepID=A0A140DSW2_9FIRM|nr:hypothetical protein AALO17_06050 [Faecalibaculum rodentium]